MLSYIEMVGVRLHGQEIEEIAIRNRAFDTGYDFLMLIPLEKCSLPSWLPKTQIWLGLDRWGIEKAAAVIEDRVTRMGGKIRVETVFDRAERIKRQQDVDRRRLEFLHSQKGVDAAHEAVSALFNNILTIVQTIRTKGINIGANSSCDNRRMAVYFGGLSMTVAWSLQWRNTLRHSALYIMFWDGAISFDWPCDDIEKIKEIKYGFDMLPNSTLGWRQMDSEKRLFSSGDLSEYLISMLMDIAS